MPAPHNCFLQAGCPSCRPINSVKALKAKLVTVITDYHIHGRRECARVQAGLRVAVLAAIC